MITRGDIVRVPSPRRPRGHEQRGARYGIVVQADELQLLSTTLVAPTSRSARSASFRPVVRIGETETRVQPEQLRTIDKSILGEPVGRVTPAELEDIEGALRSVLRLPRSPGEHPLQAQG